MTGTPTRGSPAARPVARAVAAATFLSLATVGLANLGGMQQQQFTKDNMKPLYTDKLPEGPRLMECSQLLGGGLSSPIAKTLEDLLWPYLDEPLNIPADCLSLFPKSTANNSFPWDFVVFHEGVKEAKYKPGGIVVISSPNRSSVLAGLREVAFPQPAKAPAYLPEHPWRSAKMITYLKLGSEEGEEDEEEEGQDGDDGSTGASNAEAKDKDVVIMHLAGPLDDNDYLTLGDYGNEYGEYRWGVFNRFVWRLFPMSSRAPETYLRKQMGIMTLPIDAVHVDLDFSLEEKNGEVTLKTRSGTPLKMTSDDFRSALIRDFSFALAVHQEQLSAEILDGGRARLTVRPVDAVQDYEFHPKQKPWTNWLSYFTSVPGLQPLIVVAQTIREKSLMIGDDLSDFYTGAATQALPEGRVKITLASANCSDFTEALEMHRFRCEEEEEEKLENATNASQAVEHSVFYSLAAKEKFSGDLGVAAESSLLRIFERTGMPLPPVAALSLQEEGVEATFKVFEGRTLSSGSLAEIVQQLPQGFDVLQLSGCSLPEAAIKALTPGGLIFIENLKECSDPDAFKAFLGEAAALGTVTIGRNIAVITKFGDYKFSQTRAAWPQKREAAQLHAGSCQGGSCDAIGEPMDRWAFLSKVSGLEEELETLGDQASLDPAKLRELLRKDLAAYGRSRGEVAAALDKLGQAEFLFQKLDKDKSGFVDLEEIEKLEAWKRKKKISRALSKKAQLAKEEDNEVRRSTPRAEWPEIVTAQDVQQEFPLDSGFTKVQEPPAFRPGVPNPCGLDLKAVKKLRYLRPGTREDGNSMLSYRAKVDGRWYSFKLGRFVDVGREALVAQRLTSCGSTSFGKTCGVLSASGFQDDAGFWRDTYNWKTKMKVPSNLDWMDLSAAFGSDQLGHCQDCLFSQRDIAGTYQKDGSMRAHIELCPPECVVWQVQEELDGFPFSDVARPFVYVMHAEHKRKEGVNPETHMNNIRRTVERWLVGAGAIGEPATKVDVGHKVIAITKLMVSRIFATLVHFHAKCGVVHDNLQVDDIIVNNETGHVKMIDWGFARAVRTDRDSLLELWNNESQTGVIGDKATDCDSMFERCACQWPWEALTGRKPQAWCSYFGTGKEPSQKQIQAIMSEAQSHSNQYFGEHGESFKEELRRFSEAEKKAEL